MIYSNINDMEHFYKFKMKKLGKVAKGASKVGQGAIKTGGKIGKGGLTAFKTMNPLSIIAESAPGIFGGGSSKIISYVCSALVCLILIAVIIYQLKK
jgi:hypothetical protein